MKRTRRADDTSEFRALVELAKRFPGVEAGTAYGTSALRVKGKFLARQRTEAEGWLCAVGLHSTRRSRLTAESKDS